MENEKEWEKSFADKFSVMLERYTCDMDFKDSQRAQDEVYTFISSLLTTEREKERAECIRLIRAEHANFLSRHNTDPIKQGTNYGFAEGLRAAAHLLRSPQHPDTTTN